MGLFSFLNRKKKEKTIPEPEEKDPNQLSDPGKPTADFIAKILSKITLIGALFLAFIAIVPLIFSGVTGMHGLMMGGTSVIILVGVALETGRQLESQMMVRHTKGFLD